MSYEQIDSTKPIARKEHKCIWCAEPIVKGEKYYHDISKFDGTLQNHHWHLECVDAFWKDNYDNEFEAYQNERPSKEANKQGGGE